MFALPYICINTSENILDMLFVEFLYLVTSALIRVITY
jgi:hypothetical protein